MSFETINFLKKLDIRYFLSGYRSNILESDNTKNIHAITTSYNKNVYFGICDKFHSKMAYSSFNRISENGFLFLDKFPPSGHGNSIEIDYSNASFSLFENITQSQARVMATMVATFNSPCTIKIIAEGRKVVHTKVYGLEVPASRVIHDIYRYFTTGEYCSTPTLDECRQVYENGIKSRFFNVDDSLENFPFENSVLEGFSDFFSIMNEETVNTVVLGDKGDSYCNVKSDGIIIESIVRTGVDKWETLGIKYKLSGTLDQVFEAIKDDILRAKEETDKNPSKEQIEAGNYRKGKVSLDGMQISLENPIGSKRKGVDRKGTEWEVTMPYNYGYIKGSEGNDGDHVDIAFLDDPTLGDLVCVINQINGESKFDEHKVFYGMTTKEQAVDLYCSGFSDGRGKERLGSMVCIGKDLFKVWLETGNKNKEISVSFV